MSPPRHNLDALRADTIRAEVAATSGAPITGWDSAPDPLALIASRVPAYPTDALEVVSGAAVWTREVARAYHVSEAMAGSALLGAVSAVLGGRFDVATTDMHAQSAPIPGTLFVLLVAASGEGKSRTLTFATKDLRDIRRGWEDRNAVAIAAHDAERARITAEAAMGDPYASQLLAAHESRRPVAPFTVYSDLTPEALQMVAADGPAAVITGEAVEMIAPMLGTGKGMPSRLGVLTGLWSGEPFDVRRTTQSTRKSDRPRVSIVAGIQPPLLGALLADHAAMIGQGFLARFLIAQSPPRLGERDMRAPGPSAEVAYLAANIAQRAMTAADGVDPRTGAVCILNSEAHAVHIEWSADVIEPRRHPTGDLGGAPDFTARLEEHALRLAVHLHAAQGLGATVRISVETITAAQRLAEHYAAERIALSISADDPRAAIADTHAVLAWRARNPSAVIVTARDIRAGVRRQVPTTARVTTALQRLERAGFVREHEDGARASRWAFHPDAVRLAPTDPRTGTGTAGNPTPVMED